LVGGGVLLFAAAPMGFGFGSEWFNGVDYGVCRLVCIVFYLISGLGEGRGAWGAQSSKPGFFLQRLAERKH
jgi:hypothetical protein